MLRPVYWIGSSRDDLRRIPDGAKREIGFALWFAQKGDKHPASKPLKGFKGAGVLEIVENHAGNAYRAVYTVRFARAVYVLHVFIKKSKTGIKTPGHEMDLVVARMNTARLHYETWFKEKDNEGATSKR